MRSQGGQETGERLGDRTVVPPGVEPREDGERTGHLLVGADEIVDRLRAKGVKSVKTVSVGEQSVVPEGEERSSERREDPQLVVGPLDRAQGVAQGEHLFALVEGAPPHEDVRKSAHLVGPLTHSTRLGSSSRAARVRVLPILATESTITKTKPG